VRGAAKNCKKTNETPYFGVQGVSKSSMLIRIKSSLLGLVLIGSIFMHICNHVYGRLANNCKITTFMRYRFLMPSCAGFLEPRRSRLGPLKSTFSAENFIGYAACLGLSVVNSAQFALEMCFVARNCQKIHKNPFFGVQGHPRSLNSVAIESQCTTFY